MSRRKKPSEPTAPEPQPEALESAEPVQAIRRREDLSGAPYAVTEDGVDLVRRLAAQGLSNNAIAAELRISRTTLRELRRRQPEVDEALAQGRAIDEREIADVLRRKALSGNIIAAIFYLKARHGWKEGAERDAPTVAVQINQGPALDFSALNREQRDELRRLLAIAREGKQ